MIGFPPSLKCQCKTLENHLCSVVRFKWKKEVARVCDSCSQVLQYCNQHLQSPCKHLDKRCQEVWSVNISHNGQIVTAWYYFLEAQHCYGIRLSQVSQHLPDRARGLWLALPQALFLMPFPSNTFPYSWPHLDCHVCEQDFSFGIHAVATPLQVVPHL